MPQNGNIFKKISTFSPLMGFKGKIAVLRHLEIIIKNNRGLLSELGVFFNIEKGHGVDFMCDIPQIILELCSQSKS